MGIHSDCVLAFYMMNTLDIGYTSNEYVAEDQHTLDIASTGTHPDESRRFDRKLCTPSIAVPMRTSPLVEHMPGVEPEMEVGCRRLPCSVPVAALVTAHAEFGPTLAGIAVAGHMALAVAVRFVSQAYSEGPVNDLSLPTLLLLTSN